jgi:protein-S-isoprenylcysteine O-methyltransferase Ste14
MKQKNPIIESILITSIFTLVVVGLVPLVLLHLYPAGSFFQLGILRYTGIIAFSIGTVISLACVKDFLFKGRGTPAPFDPPKTLVVEGFYQHVRNPMYLGLFLVIFAEALFFSSVPIFVYLLVLIAFANIFVRLYEEPKLSHKFGKSYEQYCTRINRWIPKFGKRIKFN